MRNIIILVFISNLCSQKVNVSFDHLIILTHNLAQSISKWEGDGYTVKKRKPHQNGIHNALIEFSNQSEIELLTVREAKDDVSRMYQEMLKSYPDESSVFVVLRVDKKSDMFLLEKNLNSENFQTRLNDTKHGMTLDVFLGKTRLPVFFIYYDKIYPNSEPWTNHRNGENDIFVYVRFPYEFQMLKHIKLDQYVVFEKIPQNFGIMGLRYAEEKEDFDDED